MRNSVTYLTRRCPRACGYCSLRDAKDVGKELTPEQWIEAFSILHQLGIDFNLILGNETWLLGENLLKVLKDNKTPFALYSTCPSPIFEKFRHSFFSSGIIDNLSCGVDYPISYCNQAIEKGGTIDDSILKSKKAWAGLLWTRQNYQDIEVHATITIHKENLPYVVELIKQLTAQNIFIALNFIHHNVDGLYDFFPEKEKIANLVFDMNEAEDLQKVLDELYEYKGFIQNPEILKIPAKVFCGMLWHCQGDPYGGPTIDADGSLRLCGYRKGKRVSKLTIFDLPGKEEEWKIAVSEDASECPGCAWTYPIGYHYWKDSAQLDKGVASFVRHADAHIPEEKWSNRKIQSYEKENRSIV